MVSVIGTVKSVLKEDAGWNVLELICPDLGRIFAKSKEKLKKGDEVSLTGFWEPDTELGKVLKVDRILKLPAPEPEGIKKLLASGLVKGIGPATAEKLASRFGAELFKILEEDPDKLLFVKGMTKERVSLLRSLFLKEKEKWKALSFLLGLGMGLGTARRVVEKYGLYTRARIVENPYRLSYDINGIGFVTADRMASRLGIPPTSPIRAKAVILHILAKEAEDGHTFVAKEELLKKGHERFGVEKDAILESLDRLSGEKEVVEEEDRIFLPYLYRAEENSAKSLVEIEILSKEKGHIGRAFKKASIELSPEQKKAVENCLSGGVSIVTGGPGTGKTTVTRVIVDALEGSGKTVLLASPTGRASERLSQATMRKAKTIHRLLEFDPDRMVFKRNRSNPLRADVILVDEFSMVDVVLFESLCDAVPRGCSLVIVGDSDQLPSVGPGNVLKDIIDSGIFPVTRLTTIFRQKRESLIIENAHRVNQGKFPVISNKQGSDFYFIERDDPSSALKTVKNLYFERIPKAFGYDPVRDIQIISPMNRGVAGVFNINKEIQAILNPSPPFVRIGGAKVGIGDKVMQVRNNYKKDVFNGDIGFVEDIIKDEELVLVRFGRRLVPYLFHETDELSLAYASSVHKSQGSEHKAVIMVLLTQHYLMLQRNLLYTAITRAKELFVLVGSKRAIAISIRNSRAITRRTTLKERLRKYWKMLESTG